MTTAETLAEWFGVQPAGGRIAAILLAAGGRIVSGDELSLRACVTRKSFNNQLKHLRKAMDPGSIETVKGEGFYLTDTGVADCRAGLADADRRAA